MNMMDIILAYFCSCIVHAQNVFNIYFVFHLVKVILSNSIPLFAFNWQYSTLSLFYQCVTQVIFCNPIIHFLYDNWISYFCMLFGIVTIQNHYNLGTQHYVYSAEWKVSTLCMWHMRCHRPLSCIFIIILIEKLILYKYCVHI